MVAIGLSAKSQSRRVTASLEFPSPQWGGVRGELLKGDSGQKQAGMTMRGRLCSSYPQSLSLPLQPLAGAGIYLPFLQVRFLPKASRNDQKN